MKSLIKATALTFLTVTSLSLKVPTQAQISSLGEPIEITNQTIYNPPIAELQPIDIIIPNLIFNNTANCNLNSHSTGINCSIIKF